MPVLQANLKIDKILQLKKRKRTIQFLKEQGYRLAKSRQRGQRWCRSELEPEDCLPREVLSEKREILGQIPDISDLRYGVDLW
jgi:hypothetical protein